VQNTVLNSEKQHLSGTDEMKTPLEYSYNLRIFNALNTKRLVWMKNILTLFGGIMNFMPNNASRISGFTLFW
jgi:hypothetical protein